MEGDKASKVRTFYNEFSRDVLLRDFIIRNKRQVAIEELCSRFIQKDSRVLEVGCGVGIITKFLLKEASVVHAIDISETNIRVARSYVDSKRCQFHEIDITKDLCKMKRFGPFHFVLLADVLEHIPKDNYVELFNCIESLLDPKGIVIITTPSGQYQEYLKQNKPQAVQIIDETITIQELFSATSLTPRYFSYVDIWGQNQYLHIVFQAGIEYVPIQPRRPIIRKVRSRLNHYFWRLKNLLFLSYVSKNIQNK